LVILDDSLLLLNREVVLETRKALGSRI